MSRKYSSNNTVRRDRHIATIVSVAALAVFIALPFFLGQSISPDCAVRTAQALGYSDVQVTDRHNRLVFLVGCDKSDQVRFDVTATDQQGITRAFLVCDGVFKGAAPRFN